MVIFGGEIPLKKPNKNDEFPPKDMLPNLL